MMHCHNLVHEDHDMMGQFEIRNPLAASHDATGRPPRASLPESDLLDVTSRSCLGRISG